MVQQVDMFEPINSVWRIYACSCGHVDVHEIDVLKQAMGYDPTLCWSFYHSIGNHTLTMIEEGGPELLLKFAGMGY